MKITGIKLEAWLAHRNLDVATRPFHVIAGPNGAGKTSIAHAVRFAWFGEGSRVELKKDRQQLVSDGAKRGTVTIAAEGFVVRRDVASGKATVTGKAPIPPGAARGPLGCVVDPALFTTFEPDARRDLLMRALDVSTARIKQLLEERGHRPELLEVLANDGTLEDWRKIADRGASEARGAWKAATGELYGSVKAADWSPAMPEIPDQETIARLNQEAESAQEAEEAQIMLIGENRATAAAAAAWRGKMQNLRYTTEAYAAQAFHAPTLEVAHRKAVAEIEDAERKLQEALYHMDQRGLDCPHCGGQVTLMGERQIAFAPSTKRVTKEDVTEAREVLAKAKLAETKVNRELSEARQAMANIESAQRTRMSLGPDPEPDFDKIAAATQKLEEIRDWVRRTKAAVDAVRAAQIAERQARARAAEAHAHHATVQAWEKIAADLAPSGIPAELGKEAMGRFNATLASLSVEASWPAVRIDAEMDISAGGRPFRLLSESEQWRSQVILAIGLALVSELRLVVLDRFDVLDVPSRRPTMAFLNRLIANGRMETVLLLGTLTEPPKVPASVGMTWLGAEKGVEKAA